MIFAEFRSWFDERFSFLLDEKIKAFSAHSSDPDIGTIASYIQTLGRGGKRFRPFLVSCGIGESVDHEKHFALYAAVELLHLFALIHDDIMDSADTRHGVLCAHTKFTPLYGAHTAEAVAILLGDIVFAWAYEALGMYTKEHPEHSARLYEVFHLLVSEVTHGQLLDVLSPQQPPLSEARIIEKMTLKTAHYSFVQPLRLGFIVQGDDPAAHAFATAFGTALGIAFQLQDDLLDSTPTTVSGKTTYTDIQTKQQTVISCYMETRAADEYKQTFRALFGVPHLTEENKKTLETVLSESGALAYVKKYIDEYFAAARNAITTYQMGSSPVWEGIINLVAQREK